MLNIGDIFKNRVPDTVRLVQFGFSESSGIYSVSVPILDGQFFMVVTVTVPAGESTVFSAVSSISAKVFESADKSEYVLVQLPDVQGAFVGSVIQSCEENLKHIAEQCFVYAAFKSVQAKFVIEYAEKTYQSRPEFLWEKFSSSAVLRRKDSGLWYAVLLTIERSKLVRAQGVEFDGAKDVGAEKDSGASQKYIEVLDVRAEPDEIPTLIACGTYFGGYHMNKKHWVTVCFDGSVPIQEIYARLDASYILADKKRRKK